MWGARNYYSRCKGDWGMPQFITDFWSALDWPNMIGSAIVGAIVLWLTSKIYPMWQKSRETSRIVLTRRKKSAVKRDLRTVLRMQYDPNYMSLWCTERAIIVGSFTAMIVVFVVLFALYVLIEMGKKETHGATWYPYAIMGIMTGPMTLLFLELWNFSRVANYYRKFDEFLKRVHEVLTIDEIAAVEKDEKTASRKPR